MLALVRRLLGVRMDGPVAGAPDDELAVTALGWAWTSPSIGGWRF